ncbi:MAG TPA: hypothetical protein VNH19_17595 [Candidatus Limnocylindrales bacterium]|nr:hypothetical protein [Candidatus Limnocylindrales bacterium]
MTNWEKLEDFDLGEIRNAAKRIADAFEELVCLLKRLSALPAAKGFTFKNTGDKAMATNFTVVPGQPFQVTASTIPTGGLLQAGSVPVWTVDDASVTLTPDATGLVVNGTTVATDTAPSFNLTLTGINSDGVTISNTQNMAFVAAPPVPATGFSFVQNS